MRLINTSTHKLQEFFDNGRPPYAILSHTWSCEEISYQQWQRDIWSRWPDSDDFLHVAVAPEVVDRMKTKAGFQKIVDFCRLCKERGYSWAWVDTIAIDKSSSAELSEAINSMFNWYEQSSLCVVHLSDVTCQEGFHQSVQGSAVLSGEHRRENLFNRFERIGFPSSRWFTRGWTFQELLAPAAMLFYDSAWTELADRNDLCDVLVRLTGIPKWILWSSEERLRRREESISSKLSRISIAQKMSWAAHRTTTRSEDIAYCLLGIFDINMPLLYGEGGAKAFKRLQEEIIKKSTDQSIFAWCLEGEFGPLDATEGSILAESPKAFAWAGKVYRSTTHEHEMMNRSHNRELDYAITNHGLHIQLPLYTCPICTTGQTQDRNISCYLAVINCSIDVNKVDPYAKTSGLAPLPPIDFSFDGPPSRIGICLRTRKNGQYQRHHCHNVMKDIMGSPPSRSIYVQTEGKVWYTHSTKTIV